MDLRDAQGTGNLEQVRVGVLGKKGELTALLRGILELLNGNQNSWLVYRMDDGCVSAMGTYDEAHGLRFTDCITPDELRPMLRADAVTKKGEPRYYVEPLTRAGYAYIFGGGHVGAALVPVLPRRSTIRRLSASFSAIIWTLARI